MLQKTSRRLIAGAVAALALCLPAGADVVFEDFEDGLNVNLYGGYWYTYESGYNPKINLPDLSVSGGVGSMNLAGMNGDGKDQEVVIGTNLKAAGVGSEWAGTGVQSITFKAKGPAGLKFNFYLNTLKNDGPPENWNKYGKQLTISGTDWNTFSVNLTTTDLKQNSGGTAANGGATFTFDKTEVTKLAWSVKKTENSGVNSGTFAVDDVKLIGTIEDSDPTLCKTCVLSNFVVPPPSALLNDFSTDKNALGYYDGHEYKNNGSTVTRGNAGRGGNGVSIDFTVGGTGDKYVGISINLADEDFTKPLDASGFTGVYFEYKTTEIKKMVFAVVEKSGAIDPKGKDYYKNLPPTNGEWKAARVNFTDLELPVWAQEQEPTRTLDKTQLAMLQFAYKDAGTGTIAIDNIYFIGADKFPEVAPPVIKYALTYKVNVNAGGRIAVGDGTPDYSRTDSVAAGAKGPTVTVVPSDAYYFEKWDDGVTETSRTDEATADKVFTAIFKQKLTITYVAGPHGHLLVDGSSRDTYTVTLKPGVEGPKVVAVGDIEPRYQFVKWSDDLETADRTDKAVDVNLTFTAEFELFVPALPAVKVTYKAGEGGGVGHIAKNDLNGFLVAYPDAINMICFTDINICGDHICNNSDISKCVYKYERSLHVDSLLAPGDSITVTALPDSGVTDSGYNISYKFLEWSDGVKTAKRTDKYEGGPVNVTALFVLVTPTDPEREYFTLSYAAGDGGRVKAEGADSSGGGLVRIIESGKVSPKITAVPDSGYRFVKWNDGNMDSVRTDTAKANRSFIAEFINTDTATKTYKVTYVAGSGGKLSVNAKYDALVTGYDTTVSAGMSAAVITAVPDSGYTFVGWSGGSIEMQRFNTNVQANVSDTAIFKQVIAVASPNREIPTAPAKEIAAVAPVAIIAGELTVGPNPASVAVNFFRTGRAIKSGKLTVYDASGNVVTTVSLNDKGTTGKRIVGSWNLKDNKGRQAANGSYVVKGVVTTKNGTKEKVSTIIAVAK